MLTADMFVYNRTTSEVIFSILDRSKLVKMVYTDRNLFLDVNVCYIWIKYSGLMYTVQFYSDL